MNDSTEIKPAGGSDMMVAVGAIMCVALGASLTYWLMHGATPAAANGQVVALRESKPLNPGKPDPNAPVVAKAQPGAKAADTTFALPATSADGDFLPVTFATLSSFYYELPGIEEPIGKAPLADQIPAPVRALSDKKVAVQGFMVPTDLKGGKCTTFLLVKDQSLCCFGRMPRMNEWISVRTKPGKPARAVNDQPVTVFGSFSVGELKDTSGEILSIYRMEAEDVAGPLDL